MIKCNCNCRSVSIKALSGSTAPNMLSDHWCGGTTYQEGVPLHPIEKILYSIFTILSIKHKFGSGSGM